MFKSPFECLCSYFILPEFFEHVYLFSSFFNFRKILYLIKQCKEKMMFFLKLFLILDTKKP
ncbi:MAG TPA: hypothetical protein DEW22_04005 [Clostridiales bacterium]|nr:hypothetical protein [Clostridiales bacterium]